MSIKKSVTVAAVWATAALMFAGAHAQGGGGAQGAAAPARQGGAARGGGGRQAGPPAPGTLIAGQWGAAALPLDSKGWGWQAKSYVSSDYKRPFWSKAKEMLFSDKQVTSYTISNFNPTQYREVRKHFGFIWFEMQHSTMSWDEVAKMIAACPGPDGASPMIRMPDQDESSIQKATDLGAIGLIFPTMRDGHQSLEAARYSRFPPFARRSSGAGQAGSVWSNLTGGQQYSATFNDNMLVTVMIETVDGVLNIDEIASTFGLDVVIEGNNDLSRFSGWSQDDARYLAMMNVIRNASMKAGKYWGAAGAQYLTGSQWGTDIRFVQNGPSMDGWTPPARGGRGPAAGEEPTIGMPGGAQPGGAAAPAGGGGGGRGRRGGGAGAPTTP